MVRGRSDFGLNHQCYLFGPGACGGCAVHACLFWKIAIDWDHGRASGDWSNGRDHRAGKFEVSSKLQMTAMNADCGTI